MKKVIAAIARSVQNCARMMMMMHEMRNPSLDAGGETEESISKKRAREEAEEKVSLEFSSMKLNIAFILTLAP